MTMRRLLSGRTGRNVKPAPQCSADENPVRDSDPHRRRRVVHRLAVLSGRPPSRGALLGRRRPASGAAFAAVPGLERLLVVKKRPPRCTGCRCTRRWRGRAGIWSSICADRPLPGSFVPESAGYGQRRPARAPGPPARPACSGSTRRRARCCGPRRHRSALPSLVPPGPPVLAIGPAANWRGKQWRAERFAELARRLMAPDGSFGGRGSRCWRRRTNAPRPSRCSRRCRPRAVDLVGRTDVLTAAAVASPRAVHRQRYRADAHRRRGRDADPRPVRSEPGRATRLGADAPPSRRPRSPPEHARPGLRSPHDRYADGQPVGRAVEARRSGCGVARSEAA